MKTFSKTSSLPKIYYKFVPFTREHCAQVSQSKHANLPFTYIEFLKGGGVHPVAL
jgi:hypothetical protein